LQAVARRLAAPAEHIRAGASRLLTNPSHFIGRGARHAGRLLRCPAASIGRVTSFFSDSELPAPNFGDLRFDDPTNADVNLLAYTVPFGNGFSATLSLEDAIGRRVTNPLEFPLFGVGAEESVFAPLPFTYAGELMPDVVGNLRYAGSWGSVQLSGALHQIRDVSAGLTTVDGVVVPVLNPITGLRNPTFADTHYGFAVALNGQVPLPFLGEDDAVWMSATYTDGAVGYINAGQTDPITDGTISAGPLALPFADAFVDPLSGEFKTNKAYGIAGGINHVWNSAFQTNIFGSWMRFDAPGIASFLVPSTAGTIAAGTAGTVTGLVDFNEYRIGTNSIWTPVSGLNIGAEVLYTRVDPRGRVAVPITNAAG